MNFKYGLLHLKRRIKPNITPTKLDYGILIVQYSHEHARFFVKKIRPVCEATIDDFQEDYGTSSVGVFGRPGSAQNRIGTQPQRVLLVCLWVCGNRCAIG